MRRFVVTGLWALGLALLGVGVMPALDWVGDVMGFPASYGTGTRILLVAIGVVAVIAIWRSFDPPASRPPDRDAPVGG